MNKQTLRRMVGGGLFAAIIVVLQLIGGGIRFGTFSISLVLVPIVVGTAVYGWQMGGWLGLVFGAAVLLSGDANLFMTINPAGTIATVLIKGMQALFTGTAQLPDIRIEAPAHVICTETVESLQAGAVYGAAAMTDGLVERMESELGRPCTAVVTGGLGRFVVPHCRRRLVYDEHLLLRGLGMIWRRAQGEIHSCGAMGNAV